MTAKAQAITEFWRLFEARAERGLAAKIVWLVVDIADQNFHAHPARSTYKARARLKTRSLAAR